ncbi:hypothetical protein Daus18300_000168 [Diaporthe australafricana]|uniref:Lysophospholipase n=1 Tax=Diaporthe australafricana TaxID=127596 RepID=A0ABR3Y8Q7_9PEZI
MTYRSSDHFHIPGEDEETEEQIAYEKELLSQQYQGHADEEGPDESTTTRPLDRGLRHSQKDSSSGSGFRTQLKGFVKDLKATSQSAARFISLESRMTKELDDPARFPEISQQAVVRNGLNLCPEENVFLDARKARMRGYFAKYMGLDAAQVHPDDIPTVAFGGSGGGYRAMLAFLGYSLAMKDAGLWDLLTYVAGVSGSCWAIAAYYAFGQAEMQKVIDHCKKRLAPHHPLSPEAVQKLLSSPKGNYETLGPLIQKSKSGLHTVPMDLYAVFTTGYLFLEEDPMIKPIGTAASEVAGYHKAWWKWTDAKCHLADGAEPLPILTAIRHERPWKDWVDEQHPFGNQDPKSKEHQNASDAWWQWFEISPYELGCDELEAWCPTWGFGRQFEGGKSVRGLPEQSLALLLGLCTSAPAGPLSSYLATLQRNLPKNFLGDAINNLASGVAAMWGKQDTAVFTNHHPLHASNEHNFLYHLTPTPAGSPRPPGIENSPRVHLLDSGMDNNCPTYVMLHPSRKVDVILNMDASSDVQKDSFQQRVSQIGLRRGLDFRKRRPNIEPAPDSPAASVPERFQGLYAQIYDGARTSGERPATVVDSYGQTVTNPPAPAVVQDCTMVYLPLLPNERAVPGYDPSTAKFSGSYNLVWTPEQVDMIIGTSVANFQAGQDTVKEALFDAWQRKKAMREADKRAGEAISS